HLTRLPYTTLFRSLSSNFFRLFNSAALLWQSSSAFNRASSEIGVPGVPGLPVLFGTWGAFSSSSEPQRNNRPVKRQVNRKRDRVRIINLIILIPSVKFAHMYT